MGHYASEMDPDFGKPTFDQQRRAEARQNAIDELTKVIARAHGMYIPAETSELPEVVGPIKDSAERIVDSIIYAVR